MPLNVRNPVSRSMLVGSLAFTCLGAAAGCSGSDPSDDFYFSAADVERLAIGEWTGPWTAGTAPAATFTLAIHRPLQPGMHPTCARELGSDPERGTPALHPLCISTSTMRLDAELTTSDGKLTDAPLRGEFMLVGQQLVDGDLMLSNDALDLRFRAHWVGGHWETCNAEHSDGAPWASCALERRTK
jgi:hypothetical protein